MLDLAMLELSVLEIKRARDIEVLLYRDMITFAKLENGKSQKPHFRWLSKNMTILLF